MSNYDSMVEYNEDTITVRKFFYKIGIFKKNKFKTPIIIVGNLTVGGTGKTPLTIWLYNYFFERGLKAGIISSGYKSSNKNPSIIKDNSSAKIFGDEAVLIYEKTKGCVISGKDRVLATHMMEREFNCDLMVSMVLVRALKPSRAKNSHCRGIITDFEATSPFIVKSPNAGGQSIKIKS